MFFLVCEEKRDISVDSRVLNSFFFFQKELSHIISLHPAYLGPNMHKQIREKLYADVEGTCTGRYGYIITVVKVGDISKGKVLPGTGLAEFNVKYQAIVFKPYKGEVVDAVVTTVNKVWQVAREHPFDTRGTPIDT